MSYSKRKEIDPPSRKFPFAPVSGWVVFWAIVLCLILIPFFLFGDRVEDWTKDLLHTGDRYPMRVSLLFGGMLALDVFFPVPSSLVSTGAGALLGLFHGFLISSIGMSIGCVIGYMLGKKVGKGGATRLVGKEEIRKLEELDRRIGTWILVICRPIPVLAEASVVFAGMAGMEFMGFLAMTTLSNAGISMAYSAIGVYSRDVQSFLLAFFGSITVPLMGMGLSKIFQKAVENKGKG